MSVSHIGGAEHRRALEILGSSTYTEEQYMRAYAQAERDLHGTDEHPIGPGLVAAVSLELDPSSAPTVTTDDVQALAEEILAEKGVSGHLISDDLKREAVVAAIERIGAPGQPRKDRAELVQATGEQLIVRAVAIGAFPEEFGDSYRELLGKSPALAVRLLNDVIQEKQKRMAVFATSTVDGRPIMPDAESFDLHEEAEAFLAEHVDDPRSHKIARNAMSGKLEYDQGAYMWALEQVQERRARAAREADEGAS